MSEAPINLQQFCSKDPMRPYLHKPFSRGKFTYATDGRIAVRVDRIVDIAEQEKPDPEKLFDQYFKDEPRGTLEVAMPEIKEDWQDCRQCGGSGREHDCPACTCGECEECAGNGRINHAPTAKISIGAATYDAKYVKQVLSLPGVRFPVSPPKDAAAGLIFDGGAALLMPMRWDGETEATATVKLEVAAHV
jgi:hypothetical protein